MLAAIVVATPSIASAEPSYELKRTNTTFLLAESGASLALLIGGNLFDTPSKCRWCESNAFDNAGHDAFRVDNPKTANTASNLVAFAAVPAAGLAAASVIPLFRDQSSDVLPNTALMLNTLMLDVAITAAVKLNVARQRPAFYYGHPEQTSFAPTAADANLSFFSGHTSVAFCLAASSSTIAFLRGYDYAPYVAVGTGLAAASAGMLRIAAEAHWPTDVIAGAAVGTAIGAGIPLLLHARSRTSPTSLPTVTAVPPVGTAPAQVSLTMLW